MPFGMSHPTVNLFVTKFSRAFVWISVFFYKSHRYTDFLILEKRSIKESVDYFPGYVFVQATMLGIPIEKFKNTN